MKHHAGFTLLEILIALAVFAILATITSSAMYHAFNTRARINIQADHLNTLQLTLALINRDTQQIINRAVRGNDLHLFPPFTGQQHYVEFTRTGDVNPMAGEARSTLVRIAYLCHHKQLIRRRWQVLDTPNRNQYQDRVLLDNLNYCQMGYLAHNQDLLSTWQEYALKQNQTHETLPKALQLNLDLAQLGKISLLFIIPEGLYGE